MCWLTPELLSFLINSHWLALYRLVTEDDRAGVIVRVSADVYLSNR